MGWGASPHPNEAGSSDYNHPLHEGAPQTFARLNSAFDRIQIAHKLAAWPISSSNIAPANVIDKPSIFQRHCRIFAND